MKYLLFLFLLTASSAILKAQDIDEFAAIDSRVQRIPGQETYSTNSIANYIQANFTTDKEKMCAAYAWVISNIEYDKDSMYLFNYGKDNDVKLSATLKKRKGVCENFASLFTDILLKMGLQSCVVYGYTKINGTVKWIGHSWCAVYFDKKWYLCDPTWDAGAGSNTNYFLVDPAEFLQAHMPFDPLWQLQDYPITNREFYENTIGKKKPLFHFADTANAFMRLDSLQQLEATSRRMFAAGIENDNLRLWNAYYEMKIAIIYGEQDMSLYNSAVDDVNKATNIFNDFIQYRNNRFIPAKKDEEIRRLLDPIDTILPSAYSKTDEIGRRQKNFQYNPGSLIQRLDTLQKHVQEQKDFLTQYLALSKEEREKLFY